ncbi:MAG: hypothetical protein CMP36_02780 [Rickettsiales bacterium]|nr:hypothetical protein [Rickettsiales bacterium]OUV79610.1 MAG: hypothetical protein CBC91_03465 [Rickettsiales bacterium TMED131]|tara:strand:+ start:2578 stop:2883 length:306 start_codon:yes stop_codon:yes gene_type:complete
MDNYTYEIKNLKKVRDKEVRKLSKLLKLLVSAEWEMVSIANEKNDKVSFAASKSVAEASKNIQHAISQLILTDFSNNEKQSKVKNISQSIQPLKKVVLGKK